MNGTRTSRRGSGPGRQGTPLVLALALVTMSALAGTLSGCSRQPGPAAVMSTAQADRLALARFNDYQAGASALDASVPISGLIYRVRGRIDWRAHRGLATITAPNQSGPEATQLLQWTPTWLAVRGRWSGPLPSTLPADGWTLRRWQDGADLDTALRLMLDLSADRPENAQLLSQSGAVVLGTDHVDGVPVTLYQGPPNRQDPTAGAHTRYWIDDDGRLRRFAARFGQNAAWTSVDLEPGTSPPVAPIPGTQNLT